MRRIVFTAHRKAELIDEPDHDEPLKPGEVRGRTVISLTSPGTELNGGFLATTRFPRQAGYACIFEVEETAADVKGLVPGALAFASGNHAEKQSHSQENVIPLPPGSTPERAVFARLMGVSMSTLNTTTARPPARVLVTGLGPVGNLAAQIFAACGYEVTAVDPVAARRDGAVEAGLTDVRASVDSTEGGAEIKDQVALHVECSGHEQAVLDGCRCVRKRGEVVLVGVPWSRKTELYSYDLLHAIFHKYVVLRSGWEWEVPRQSQDFCGSSLAGNYAAALRWIAEGRVKVDHLAISYAPGRAQEVYTGLLTQSLPAPAVLFDWRLA